jgi:predicted kinase
MKSLSLTKPNMIVMVGIPGSGKTFFAEKFAETFNAPYASLERIAALSGDEKSAGSVLKYQIDELLKTQKTIIVDGMSDTHSERGELAKLAKKADYEILVIWTQTDLATAKSRSVKEVKNKTNHTLSSDNYDALVKRFSPPSAIEKPVVISGKHTYAAQARVVLKKLSEPRAKIPAPTVPTRAEQPARRNISIR